VLVDLNGNAADYPILTNATQDPALSGELEVSRRQPRLSIFANQLTGAYRRLDIAACRACHRQAQDQHQ
jgi:hypothetical protein